MDVILDDISLAELAPDNYLKAYGLARLSHETAPQAAWIARIESWQKSPGSKRGVIGVQNPFGYLVALFFYQVKETPDLGRVLEVSELTIPAMFKNLVSSHFVPMLDAIAAQQQCWTIHIPAGHLETVGFLRSQEGFDHERSGLYRYLPRLRTD
jgi:hypothetical protein